MLTLNKGNNRFRSLYCATLSGPGSTSNPAKCPSGTFSNKTGNQVAGDCDNCTQGFYCQDEGLTTPNGPCAPGKSWYI